MSDVVLDVEHLSKTYELGKRHVQALSDVNLQVKRGEFVSVMGPSGSGKTTLLNVLGCLDTPTSGRVLLDDVDVTKMSEKELYRIRRSKVGFVFQTFNLLPYLNARENVELPMECVGKPAAERRRRALELLAKVGLAERAEHRPQLLSAGEQQRVAIARALANEPAIILADEPTGNLDAKSKHEIIKLLADLNLKQGTTIVMVTHDQQIASYTERMVYLNSGRITREKQGTLAGRKKHACPYCGGKIEPGDETCGTCGKPLMPTEEA
jgi:putative ABC transport system ATP-binding protein